MDPAWLVEAVVLTVHASIHLACLQTQLT